MATEQQWLDYIKDWRAKHHKRPKSCSWCDSVAVVLMVSKDWTDYACDVHAERYCDGYGEIIEIGIREGE